MYYSRSTAGEVGRERSFTGKTTGWSRQNCCEFWLNVMKKKKKKQAVFCNTTHMSMWIYFYI